MYELPGVVQIGGRRDQIGLGVSNVCASRYDHYGSQRQSENRFDSLAPRLKHKAIDHIGKSLYRAFLVEFAAARHVVLRYIEHDSVHHESCSLYVDFPGQTRLMRKRDQFLQLRYRPPHHRLMALSKVRILQEQLTYDPVKP